jgi:hypothetical protein
MFQKTFNWLDERLGLNTIYSTVLDRKVPKVNWWFTLGSASLFLFLLQGITGIMLSVYYVPSPDHAYDSIQYIMTGVSFGWLIRGIHHWGASLMVLIVFIHMLRTYYFGAYKYPRPVAFAHFGYGLYRLPAALEPAGLLGHNGGHLHRRYCALHWEFHQHGPAWGERPLRGHPGTFLLRTYLVVPGPDCRVDWCSPVYGYSPGHLFASQRRRLEKGDRCERRAEETI